MVANRTTIKFDAQGVKRTIYERLVQRYTKFFSDYADNRLQDMIREHTFKNDTYNTENSYCWCVFFDGKLRNFGFNVSPQRAFKKAKFQKKDVDGRREAELFIRKYKPEIVHGWEVVWAATTPYAPLLESGTEKMKKFLVISSQYDEIKQTFENLHGTVEFKIKQ